MRILVATGLAAFSILTSRLLAAETTPVGIARGAPIGVVNLLDAELTHYHDAGSLEGSFVKIEYVNWSVDAMLNEAAKAQLTQLGLRPVPLAMTVSLEHSREVCFVHARVVKGFSKDCSRPLAQLATDAGVDLLIVMAPGLNHPNHTGDSHRDERTGLLRGWGFLSHESQETPTLFNETELLLIGFASKGGAILRARQWGGDQTQPWETYTPPPNPKEIPLAMLNSLRPFFASMLSQQTKGLLNQVTVGP